MSTQMIIYLCGSLLIIAIFARWSWQQEKGKDITLSDLTFFIFVSFILGLLSWVGVILWLFCKMDKYSDKVIIRRKRNRTMSKAEEKAQNRYPTLAETYAFIDGYEQAEEDNELTWEDMFDIFRLVNVVLDDYADGKTRKEVGEEVLKRFKEKK